MATTSTPPPPKTPPPVTPPPEEKGFNQMYQSLKEKLNPLEQPAIIYTLLVIALALLFFTPFVGGLLLGIIVGMTFSGEMIRRALQIKEAIEKEEVARGVILGVLCLALFITAPGLIIGGAIGVCIQKALSYMDKAEDSKEIIVKPESVKTETPKKPEAEKKK